jgi:hypothetical protein
MKNLFLVALLMSMSFQMSAQDSLSSKSTENKPVQVIEMPATDLKSKNNDLFKQGQNDALIHYKGYKTAGTAVLATTIIPGYGILFGAAPLIFAEGRMPLDENLGYPDLKLMENEQYALGYRQKAKQIKSKKLLRNYYAGLGVQASYLIYFLSALIILTVK